MARSTAPLLIVDNYDSFTYNLVHLIRDLAGAVPLEVHRNDALTVDAVLATPPGGIIISPGPGGPADAGISLELIERCPPSVPLLSPRTSGQM